MKTIHESYPKLPTLAERLSYVFSNHPLSQSRVAKEVGMAQPTLSDLIAGKNKTSSKTEKIAEVLGVDSQWLITGIPSDEANTAVTFVNVPLLENFEEHINTKSKVQIKKPAKFMQLDIKSLKNKAINFHDARYIPMTDKGMGLLIKEDSPVFFDSTQTLIEDGSTYVYSHGGLLQVRHLANAPLGGVKIIPFDSNFESYTLDVEQQEQQLFQILGQVFAVVNYY
ncbi:helix-turn-helix domain-containing protein [Acinetobacter nosocomialis]|uniref:helix-turn-helix domain-containing protein n=1 Tax=Acinetobacter calcoaceticus/baumannii complex TaxID=909768 RepID=UPI00233E7BCD|nr:helix-turn-helix domain-containing protein [Acinetobacter baumannii]MDC5567264.1 helix-turn-helix domain-containing protein [Acinetobacter baumannii]MDK2172872.1 helix-turn-helix domain-containing protein [Acinetobacter baumannii]MDK2183676.1 helix-turn-helix domain-containing protein [Acinetobacter baumannii]MDK2329500.1 helix-turn-helix domain-containing protein [Acinetobacter baumannii]